jgi:hypothetical protein
MNRIKHAGQVPERIQSWPICIKQQIRQLHLRDSKQLRRKLLPSWMKQRIRQLERSRSAPQVNRDENTSRKSLLILAMLSLMAIMGGASANAQDPQLTAYIPFAFNVGTSTLPAGDYALEPQGDGQYYWLIRNDQGKPAVFGLVTTEGTNEDWSAKLLFNRYGNTYFLSQIGYPGETYELPASPAERELASVMARNHSHPNRLYVLASLR